MKERPIIFGTETVKSVLDGRKSQTRRLITKAWDGFTWAGAIQPAKINGWIAWWPGNVDPDFTKKAYDYGFPCPYAIGDKLWVRETWANVLYKPLFLKADNVDLPKGTHWRPSIHMPRWASRISLEIVDVRVECLNQITEEDARAEGCISNCEKFNMKSQSIVHTSKWQFMTLWDTLYPKKPEYQWAENPWVWVIEFITSNKET